MGGVGDYPPLPPGERVGVRGTHCVHITESGECATLEDPRRASPSP
ncbi:hypothetical protein [Azospirillum palustre]